MRHVDRALILADMHLMPLDSSRPEVVRQAMADNERLARFLAEEASRASTLVLLGDTFNFWFERRSHVIGDYYAALSLFKLASEQGLAIHHVSGNRDYAVGEGLGIDPTTRYPGFLRLKRGFTVSRLADFGIEPHGPRFRFHQAGKTVSCIHGDSLCGKQRLFMLLRWGLLGPIGRTAMRWLPWTLWETLIPPIQNKSRGIRQPVDPADIFDEAAVAREIAMGADLLLCGHIHAFYERRVEIAGRHGRFVAIPPWLEGYYGVLENGEIDIATFR